MNQTEGTMMAGFNGSRTRSHVAPTVFDKFIIKLALAGVEENPVFRRVRLSGPTGSYEALKEHAIELALAVSVIPSGINWRTPTEDHIVLLYEDNDGDKTLVSSDAELEDAVNQYVSSGSVKIFAKPVDAATWVDHQGVRPFIHARYACGNCLTTPIAGPRYRVVELSGYHLCRTCMINCRGSGGEFTFEVATSLY